MIQVGDTCRDVLREVICAHSIRFIDFRAYYYIPRCPDYPRRPFLLRVGEEFETRLEQEINELQEGWDICVRSDVCCTGKGKMHIPQIDFEVPISPSSQKRLSDILKEEIVSLFGGGVLLESGASYQFWGTERLLPQSNGIRFEPEWIDFMAALLLTSKTRARFDIEHLVDIRWIGYSLLRGATSLRITAKTKKVLPHVVAIIEGGHE